MRTLFLLPVIVLGSGTAIWLLWLFIGRVASSAISPYFLGASLAWSMDPLAINASHFILGTRGRPFPRSGRFTLRITTDRRGRLLLSSDGRVFTLGPIAKLSTEPDEPHYQFVPERGDTVSFTRRTSQLSWPTPFRFKAVGGPSPRWQRHAYDQLVWTKAAGARLEIWWRDEQSFFEGTGWMDANTIELVAVTIRPSPGEVILIDALAGSKNWAGGDYRLETRATAPRAALKHPVGGSPNLPALFVKDPRRGVM